MRFCIGHGQSQSETASGERERESESKRTKSSKSRKLDTHIPVCVYIHSRTGTPTGLPKIRLGNKIPSFLGLLAPFLLFFFLSLFSYLSRLGPGSFHCSLSCQIQIFVFKERLSPLPASLFRPPFFLAGRGGYVTGRPSWGLTCTSLTGAKYTTLYVGSGVYIGER